MQCLQFIICQFLLVRNPFLFDSFSSPHLTKQSESLDFHLEHGALLAGGQGWEG